MPTLIKSVLALTFVLSLTACASGGCPDGTHWGPFREHCVPNR